MPSTTIRVKRNDTRPIQFKLEKEAVGGGFSPAFTSPAGVTVRFSMRLAGGTSAKISRAVAQIVQADASLCLVQYLPSALDFDTAGSYNCEIEVTYGDGRIETFPGEGYIGLVVSPDVA